MIQDVVIVGTSFEARAAFQALKEMLNSGMLQYLYRFTGFLSLSSEPNKLNDLASSLLGDFASDALDTKRLYVLAIEDCHRRQALFHQMKAQGCRFLNVVSPWCVVDTSVRLGEGNIICRNSILGCNVRLGSNNIIRGDVRMESGAHCGDSNYFGARSLLMEDVQIGNQNTVAGMSLFMPETTLGANNTIQACAVVSGSWANDYTLAGNPARPTHSMEE